MIDHFMKWTTEADAIAAAEAAGRLGHRVDGVWCWNTDHVMPNLTAWRISQDTTVPDGLGGTMVKHNYLAGWFCIVALNRRNAVIAADPATQFILDRDGPPYVVDNNIGAVIQDVACQPIFVGSHYPVSGFQP